MSVPIDNTALWSIHGMHPSQRGAAGKERQRHTEEPREAATRVVGSCPGLACLHACVRLGAWHSPRSQHFCSGKLRDSMVLRARKLATTMQRDCPGKRLRSVATMSAGELGKPTETQGQKKRKEPVQSLRGMQHGRPRGVRTRGTRASSPRTPALSRPPGTGPVGTSSKFAGSQKQTAHRQRQRRTEKEAATWPKPQIAHARATLELNDRQASCKEQRSNTTQHSSSTWSRSVVLWPLTFQV